jgi:hypothetical protein
LPPFPSSVSLRLVPTKVSAFAVPVLVIPFVEVVERAGLLVFDSTTVEVTVGAGTGFVATGCVGVVTAAGVVVVVAVVVVVVEDGLLEPPPLLPLPPPLGAGGLDGAVGVIAADGAEGVPEPLPFDAVTVNV